MANNFSAFFETLTAAAGEYNAARVGQTSLLSTVYTDVQPEAARAGKTIEVYFPDVGPMKAVNNGQLTADTVSPNYIPLTFQTRVGKALQFQDFEQWQTSTALADKFMDPLYKRCREYLNGQIAALITPANFGFNAPIVGATQGIVSADDQALAWDKLADAKCPMDDTADLQIVTHNNVYRKMLRDPQFTQESIVGAIAAQQTREEGRLGLGLNFRRLWDQQMPSASGRVIYGNITLTNGSTAVTGVASSFTTDLSVGNYLTFASDPTGTPYQVSAIASDTALTLSATYSGATQANTSARVTTILAGTVGATNGSASVTGSGTSFTTALAVGQWLTFSNDPTGTPYQILAISSNTALTLASNYAGATATGLTGTVKWYNSLAYHKYAIALGMRPIYTPPEARDVVDVSYISLMGIPLRVMISYVHIYQALFVTVDFGFAMSVIRPEFGVLIQS